MYGMLGRVLRVDLSTGEIKEEKLTEEDLLKWVGCDALAAKILYDEVPPGIPPLDPENRLIVMTGPLTGTAVQSACMHSMTFKSPATGFTVGHAHAMGRFGPMLKFSGYDGLIIVGKASKPVYLWISDGKAEIREAESLWGKDTFETEDVLRQELEKPKLACDSIGPAGENLSTMACVTHDKGHILARGGAGAVMGSKNLKAIAAYGTRKVPVANEQDFKKLAKEWREANMSAPLTKNLAKYGTNVVFGPLYICGDVPIMNYTRGVLPGYEKLLGENYIDNMLKRNVSCWGCTIAHNKVLELKGGVYEGQECEMPEYEIVAAWGSLIGVTDPTVPPVLGELCDRYGLDSLDTGNAVAFAMECFEKGLITKDDTDGIELNFGDHEAARQMIEKIAKREGFGSVLANGTMRAAERIGKGSEKFVVHVKNMALPMHDHRAFWGYGLQYAVAGAGPVHEGGPMALEMSGRLPRFSIEGKALAVKQGQMARFFCNNLGICAFGMAGVPTELITKTFSAVVGFDFTPADAEKNAMRAANIRRAFNIRNGLTPDDDTLPHRYVAEPLDEGGAKGSAINIKPMVREYYELMGWDHKTGKPFRKTLEELGLENVARDLWG